MISGLAIISTALLFLPITFTVNTRTSINYGTAAYKYQRSSNDFSVNYLGTYDGYDYEAGIKAEK
jgi:hypothetical protein